MPSAEEASRPNGIGIPEKGRRIAKSSPLTPWAPNDTMGKRSNCMAPQIGQ